MRIVHSEAMTATQEDIALARRSLTSVDKPGHAVPLPNGLMMRLPEQGVLIATFLSPHVIRIRVANLENLHRDFSYALTPNTTGVCSVETRETADTIDLWTSDGARVRIERPSGLLTIFDEHGRIVVEDDPYQPPLSGPLPGSVTATKLRGNDERYFGFGEKAFGKPRRSLRTRMWNSDTYGYPVDADPLYQSIPFFIAISERQAYGLFFDNTYRSSFDMGADDPLRYSFAAEGGELDYYVFTGGRERSARAVLKDYTDLTGRTPLPPLWSLGYHQSRWSYYPDSRVREITARFRESRIPLDVIHLDIDHMDEFRIFTWDNERFPDPARLASELAEAGIRLVVIVDPGVKVEDEYPLYHEGDSHGYFCLLPDGKEYKGRVWPGVSAFPDFTDPEVRKWFGSQYARHLDVGISGFWNDMNEPSVFPEHEVDPLDFENPAKTFPLEVRHAGDGHPGDHARYHNVYGLQMARATFEGLRRLRPDERPFVLTRAGFSGIQRYAAVWTGDNVSSWEHLALSIPMLTNLGVSGVPFVGADVGGFSKAPSGELYARWLQAAALTPLCRSHTETGSKDQEPWSYGKEFEEINRRTINFRYELLPYLYSLFHEHQETGAPPLRPLWFEYQSDPRSYDIDDQFLVGANLLVAPVVTEGALSRSVYFPAGDDWVCWKSGERFKAGTEAVVNAPLDCLPLFLRAGAAVVTQSVVQHTGEMQGQPLIVTATLGERRAMSFYEDSGNGYDYLEGNFSLLTVAVGPNEIEISRVGSCEYQRRVSHVDLLGLQNESPRVRINGTPSSSEFDQATARLRISIAAEQTGNIRIEVS